MSETASKYYNNIWKHIIKVNNIDLTKQLSILTSKNIKDSKITWNGERNQFEPRLLCKQDFSNSKFKFLKIIIYVLSQLKMENML